MSNIDNKRINASIQSHIKYMWKGNGGISAMVDQIDYIRRGTKKNSYDTIKEMVVGGIGAYVYTDDIVKFLHKLGFSDMYIRGFSWSNKRGADALYLFLMTREINDLYLERKRKILL